MTTSHFVKQLIEDDLKAGKHESIATRFPPEPNGYLHIGHAKAIWVDFEMAKAFGGKCFLRLDDTNPLSEEEEYAHAIAEDVKWLGYEWCAQTHSSDYYEKLFDAALILIRRGLAYVESASVEEVREWRGSLQKPGIDSPDRARSVAENEDLFMRMRAGEFPEGQYVLRAKIDMQSGNMNMRDPVLYRIRYAHHPKTGDAWCIYPMYDFAHPLCDALEGITHSLCSLEFQDHRPLYDWFIDNVEKDMPFPSRPVQTEFARLNISHTITSKRKLKQLVDEEVVNGWDDPRMPTLRGLRRRGFPPEAILEFCAQTGLSKSNSVIDMTLLEECVRNQLNNTAKRAMLVLNPIKVVIENAPLEAQIFKSLMHPQKPELGERPVVFSREIYIDREDFMENPPKDYFRLSPGREVRLRHAYVMKCESVIKDEQGNITELRCTIDTETLGKNPEGRKVKGVIHWVSALDAKPVTANLYDRLFTVENPGALDNFLEYINPNAHVEIHNAFVESHALTHWQNEPLQCERVGYFLLNGENANRIVSLKDTWKGLSQK